MTDPCDRYRRNHDVVTREILGETLLVPISAQLADMDNIYALNDTGAFIWSRLDGETPLAELRDQLMREFQVDTDPAWHDLSALLDELADAGLVERVR